MPFRARKKSKCHQERRNSPSVASFRPTSACFLMIFSISRSSTALSAAESISPLANLARASFSGAVRSRLPTMSARNGGVVRWFFGASPPDYRPRIANSEWRIGGDPPIPFATRYSLLATRYSLLATRYSLLATRYSLLATSSSLLATRYSLLATRYSLLATRYSLLATRYSLLSPKSRRRAQQSSSAWPIARPRPARCLLRWRRRAGRGRAMGQAED